MNICRKYWIAVLLLGTVMVHAQVNPQVLAKLAAARSRSIPMMIVIADPDAAARCCHPRRARPGSQERIAGRVQASLMGGAS